MLREDLHEHWDQCYLCMPPSRVPCSLMERALAGGPDGRVAFASCVCRIEVIAYLVLDLFSNSLNEAFFQAMDMARLVISPHQP